MSGGKPSEMIDAPRTYVTMAGKTIGKCEAGHWLPLRGDCDLCGAGPNDKCKFAVRALKEQK